MSQRAQTRWSSRALLLAVVALVAGLPFPVGEDEAAAQGSARPNVVVVMTDDQDVRSLGVMRAVREQLAQEGTFTSSFATFPLCCPSRATFLTGQYAHNHGVRDNERPAATRPSTTPERCRSR